MAVLRKINLLQTCVFLCVLIVTVLGFNLDTVIPVIKVGPDDSYFGFSVAQHQQLKRKEGSTEFDENNVVGNYIVVGAPNLDLKFSNENFTGAVYKCNALSPRRDDCELLLRNEYSPSARLDKGRNNQWLGVVVRSGGPGKGVAACAHRYKELRERGNHLDIYGIGSCYQLTQKLQYDVAMGQGSQLRPCQGYSKVLEHEEYAFCQSGISAYITQEERLVIGSPGAINWRGMLTEVDFTTRFGIKTMYRSPTVDNDPVKPPVPLISYLGYSVTGGKFDNTGQTYYVAGAPKSQNTGQIVFFTEMFNHYGNVLKYEVSQILTGDLPFSGYGQDLIVVDINSDGFDDLVVACPYFYDKEENNTRLGGAVYVYIGNGDVITRFTKPQLIKGRSLSQDECDKLQCLHARFGFSLANAGDLNRDSFGDFAVGAPYEGSGAVYIFHGSSNGVKEPYSQRIYAEDLSDAAGWNTFGYSLSGGLDLDQNTYPDLLVGSYTQNKVVLLRTRPVIMLHSNATVNPEKLNISSEAERTCEHDGKKLYCVEVELCLRYTAQPVDRFDKVDIIYSIIAEPDRISPRVEFMQDGKLMQSVNRTFTLLSQKTYSCIAQTAYLKDNITDVLSAIKFGITYKLPEKDLPVAPSPDVLPDINVFPILDPGINTAESQMAFAQVEFAKRCGDDHICQSNLQIKVNTKQVQEGILVPEIGRSSMLRVEVNIENIGEIAYQVAFYLNKPEFLAWHDSEPKGMGCQPFNKTIIECEGFGSEELGTPLRAGAVKEFALLLYVDQRNITTGTSTELSAWVNTTSEEQTPVADHINIPITVYVNADLQVFGKVEPDSDIVYSGSVYAESAIRNELMIGKFVNHTFTVYNDGPGDVESSEITIYWPYELGSKYPHGKHLLYLMHPPKVLNGGDAVCFNQTEIVNVLGVVQSESSGQEITSQNGQRRRREASTSASTSDKKPIEIREDESRFGEDRHKKNVALLDCGKKTANCYEIRCRIGVLLSRHSVQIQIHSRLWESTLVEAFSGVDEVHIRSTGKIHIPPELNIVQTCTRDDIEYATTIAIPSLQIVPKKPFAWWIIAVSALGGILLLLIVVLCLWKLGFFKRKRYEY